MHYHLYKKKIIQGPLVVVTISKNHFSIYLKCRFQFHFHRTKFDVLFFLLFVNHHFCLMYLCWDCQKYIKMNGNLIFAFEKLNKTKNQIENLLNSSIQFSSIWLLHVIVYSNVYCKINNNNNNKESWILL